jgi:hypothetical protein
MCTRTMHDGEKRDLRASLLEYVNPGFVFKKSGILTGLLEMLFWRDLRTNNYLGEKRYVRPWDRDPSQLIRHALLTYARPFLPSISDLWHEVKKEMNGEPKYFYLFPLILSLSKFERRGCVSINMKEGGANRVRGRVRLRLSCGRTNSMKSARPAAGVLACLLDYFQTF